MSLQMRRRESLRMKGMRVTHSVHGSLPSGYVEKGCTLIAKHV